MADRIDVGDKIYDELLVTMEAMRALSKEDRGVDCVPVEDLAVLADVYAKVGEHFHHKKA